MQHYEFHPAADKYGKLWSETRLNRAAADMKKHGFDRNHPIFLYDGKIIIGRNRYLAALKAGVEPRVEELRLRKGETLDEAVKRDNLERNHYTAEEEAELRAERIEEVVAARQEGKSTRTIAKQVGVSESTVRNDLASAGAQGCAPAPPNGKVTGSNGVSQAATHAKPEKKLCDGCSHNRRIGRALPKSCPACADLNRKPKGEKKPKKDKNAPSGDKDAFGNEVPKRCRDVLFDPWVEQTIDLLGTGLDKILAARIADGMRKRQKRMPHFNADDVVDGIRFIQQYMEQVIDHLRDHRPAAVCPGCQGKGCGGCLMSGLVSKIDYEVLTEKA